MSSTEEATVNADGSTTFSSEEGQYDNAGAGAADDADSAADEGMGAEGVMTKGTDPALYLGLAVLLVAGLWFFLYYRRKKSEEEVDSFFSNLDGEKFNLKLPAAVDEYYEVKAKCEEQGWEPGQSSGNTGANASGPHRVLAQALMKRCIADIPIVTHIQKESAGMNKLYSQSMCSVKQWKAYQAAEAMVSAEVDEVRAEADEIEPGWSQVIWRQAMQYHNMLKQRHEMEAKAMQQQAQAVAQKKTSEQAKIDEEKKKEDDEKARIMAAEKAAEELIKQEEREKEGKKAFKEGTGMKKGFLSGTNKKK